MNQDPIPFCNRTSSRNAPMELHYPLSGRLDTLYVTLCIMPLYFKRLPLKDTYKNLFASLYYNELLRFINDLTPFLS